MFYYFSEGCYLGSYSFSGQVAQVRLAGSSVGEVIHFRGDGPANFRWPIFHRVCVLHWARMPSRKVSMFFLAGCCSVWTLKMIWIDARYQTLFGSCITHISLFFLLFFLLLLLSDDCVEFPLAHPLILRSLTTFSHDREQSRVQSRHWRGTATTTAATGKAFRADHRGAVHRHIVSGHAGCPPHRKLLLCKHPDDRDEQICRQRIWFQHELFAFNCAGKFGCCVDITRITHLTMLTECCYSLAATNVQVLKLDQVPRFR